MRLASSGIPDVPSFTAGGSVALILPVGWRYRRVRWITRVGGSTSPTPHSTTPRTSAFARRKKSACWLISCSAELPLTANRLPPRFSNGKLQRTSLSNGATARAVTSSAEPTALTTAASSARPRTTRTRSANPRSAMTSVRKSVRRLSDSTRLTCRSGRTHAIARPGRPAPEPISTSRIDSGSSSAIAMQFSRCRSQSRGTSRGPIRPRSEPWPASQPAYRTSSSALSASRSQTTTGGAGAAGSACDESASELPLTMPGVRRRVGSALHPRTRWPRHRLPR